MESLGVHEHEYSGHLKTDDGIELIRSPRALGDINGGGVYVVPLNFQGRRYIEIPNGEASWASGFWGWRVGTHRSDYGRVGRFKIGLGYIPAKTQSRVKVEGLKAVAEIDTQVNNMTIRTSNGTLIVKGTVSSGQYVEYKGGRPSGCL